MESFWHLIIKKFEKNNNFKDAVNNKKKGSRKQEREIVREISFKRKLNNNYTSKQESL